MDTPDRLVLSTKDNPELAALFSNKQPGDKCRLELEVQVDEINVQDGQVVCSVDSAAPVNYEAEEDEGEEESEGEPSEFPPVVVAVMKGKKGGPKAT